MSSPRAAMHGAVPEGPLVAVGLMSGTSADGIDAVVVRVAGPPSAPHVTTLGAADVAYDGGLRARVLAAREARAEEIALLHAELGERFAAAVLEAIASAGLEPADVHVVGSHGQTIAHVPDGPCGVATIQIGCPARIAERTGIDVISDFRSRDAAAGGQGAPLVPFLDHVLLAPERGARLALNLGGVANVTLVRPDRRDVRAFDTGPANGPLDAAARRLLGAPYDRGGAAARRGTPDEGEVRRLLAHPWFRRPPPRSLARETFGDDLVRDLVARRADLSREDVLATLTEMVARSVVDALREHLCLGVPGGPPVQDLVVSGGGLHNDALMARLRALLAPVPVRSAAELGVDPDRKEAVAFAMLAALFVWGRAGNLPAVTGAAAPRVLGSFTPGAST